MTRLVTVVVVLLAAGCFAPASEQEQVVLFQKESAKLQFRWELCRSACWPGSLARYDSMFDDCYCHPETVK